MLSVEAIPAAADSEIMGGLLVDVGTIETGVAKACGGEAAGEPVISANFGTVAFVPTVVSIGTINVTSVDVFLADVVMVVPREPVYGVASAVYNVFHDTSPSKGV